MFAALTEKLGDAFRSLQGRGALTESNMRDGLKKVEEALLEADVSYSVVQDFMARVSKEALGEKVLKSLTPAQQLVGVVNQELINLMGPVDHSLHVHSGVTVLMLCGLQGSGKTTTCGKLARLLKERGRHPMLAACDLQRPAAIEQLHVLGQQVGVPVYSEKGATDPVKVCQSAKKQAEAGGVDVLILDTAGRLAIDQELMNELTQIDRRVEPDQVYLVVDGMTGQDAVNSAQGFNAALELDGCIMTKLDGDARGGAALSVKHVTGVPIKFIGTGEHLDALEQFHPDRMASRILGMGDILTLIEDVQNKLDQDEMARQQELMLKGQFTLDDFRKQMTQITKLGPMQKVMSMVGLAPDVTAMLGSEDVEGQMRRTFGIIDSMTAEEKRNPKKIIDQSRRRRIAFGAGVQPHEVNELIKQFDTMAGYMKEMAGLGMLDKMKMAKQMQQQLTANPNAQLMKKKGDTGKRLTPQERARIKKERDREARRRKRMGKNK